MGFKRIINSTIIILTTFVISILFIEIYASINPQKFPTYGWHGNNIMSDRVNGCKNKSSKKIIGLFGDSSIEYYIDSSFNVAGHLQKKLNNYTVCNFGLSGVGITTYIQRFQYSLDKNTFFDSAIFYFHEGNDFSKFRYTKNVNEILDYQKIETMDRKFSLPKHFVKSNYALNIIYREFFKKYFLTDQIDEKWIKKIYSQDLYYEVPIEEAMKRMKNTPKKWKKKLSSGSLNTSLYITALRNPNYYQIIHKPEPKHFVVQKNIAFHHIDFINSVCAKNKINCKIIIIPAVSFISEEAKKDWVDAFRFNYFKEIGPSDIVKSITSKYSNVYYPENFFKYNDFIKYDNHLTGHGHSKLAEFTYNLFGK